MFRRVLGWLLGVYEVDGAAPRLVVATPPGQVHELGALMVAVSAAAEGWAVTYLGPDLPVADLVSAVAQTDARAVAISVVYVPDGRAMSPPLCARPAPACPRACRCSSEAPRPRPSGSSPRPPAWW